MNPGHSKMDRGWALRSFGSSAMNAVQENSGLGRLLDLVALSRQPVLRKLTLYRQRALQFSGHQLQGIC